MPLGRGETSHETRATFLGLAGQFFWDPDDDQPLFIHGSVFRMTSWRGYLSNCHNASFMGGNADMGFLCLKSAI